MNTRTPQVGDWYYIRYGFSPMLVYVSNVFDDGLIWGSPKWLVSSSEHMSISEFNENCVAFIGNTKVRWWWRFLPFRDIVCPFPKPKGLLL